MSKDNLKGNQKGFSMIDLVIYIAIGGIILSAIAPSYTMLTRKMKLKTDIQSVQTFQNILDVYAVDHDGKLPEGIKDKEVISPGVYKTLIEWGYLDAKDVVKVGNEVKSLNLQTEATNLKYDVDSESVKLYIDYDQNKKAKKSVGDLTEREKYWVILPD